MVYNLHNKNLITIEKALTKTSSLVKQAIRKSNIEDIIYHQNIYILLLGAYIENRLNKIIFENSTYKDIQIESISQNSESIIIKWNKIIEISFIKNYNLSDINILKNDIKIYKQYELMIEIIKDYISPLMELRNKIAHGQWIYPISNTNKLNSNLQNRLNSENILSLQFKLSLVKVICNIINDLVVSPIAFKRDFSNHYKSLSNINHNLATEDYEKFKLSLIKRSKNTK